MIGSGAEWEAAAEEVGRLLAESGCAVVTGGLDEVMAAAHRGAKSAGGATIAILPGESRSAANPWADHVVVTGIGHARNLAVAASGDAVIAVGGSYGTIAEMAFALRLGRRSSLSTERRPWMAPSARPRLPRRSARLYDTSARRRSRKRLSGSLVVSSSARRYDSAASSRRSSRRKRSARAAWKRW